VLQRYCINTTLEHVFATSVPSCDICKLTSFSIFVANFNFPLKKTPLHRADDQIIEFLVPCPSSDPHFEGEFTNKIICHIKYLKVYFFSEASLSASLFLSWQRIQYHKTLLLFLTAILPNSYFRRNVRDARRAGRRFDVSASFSSGSSMKINCRLCHVQTFLWL